jgi:hypothetical protein
MPRKKPSITTPVEVLIGYVVTRPLDRVQESLSHVNTIVRSRTMHMRTDTSASTEVSAETYASAHPRAKTGRKTNNKKVGTTGETVGAAQMNDVAAPVTDTMGV